MLDLRCAPAGDWGWFDRAWPLLERAHAEAILSGRQYKSFDEIVRLYEIGHAQLWIALNGDEVRAAMLTTSHGDTLHLWLCGGDGCDWRALGEGIVERARGYFRRVTIDGRRGWGRVLHGFVRCDEGLERII